LSVHGGNRLASNSLLDGLVFGRLLGESLGSLSRPFGHEGSYPYAGSWASRGIVEETEHLTQQIRQIAWSQAGITRDEAGLRKGLSLVDEITEQLPSVSSLAHVHLHNMALVSHVILKSALYRTESRGGHFRRDYPSRNDEHWRCHTVVARQSECELAMRSANVQRLAE
jgi:L-aspartate oxidase